MGAREAAVGRGDVESVFMAVGALTVALISSDDSAYKGTGDGCDAINLSDRSASLNLFPVRTLLSYNKGDILNDGA